MVRVHERVQDLHAVSRARHWPRPRTRFARRHSAFILPPRGSEQRFARTLATWRRAAPYARANHVTHPARCRRAPHRLIRAPQSRSARRPRLVRACRCLLLLMAGDAELAELRRTELEALTSILGADFRVLQQTAWGSAATSQPQTCEVVLRPEEDQQKEQVAVVAHLVLTKTYPNLSLIHI